MIQILTPIIFSIILWFMNYFVLKTTQNPVIYSFLIIIFVWITLLLNQKKPSLFSRILYFITLLMFAIFAQLFIFFLIGDLLKISRIYILIFTLILATYGVFNSQKIKIKKYDLNLGKKVILLSDLHIGPANRERKIKKVIDMTNSLNPDIVLISGDLADMSTKSDEDLFKMFKKIKQQKYMVHGNHELYDGKKHVEELLGSAKINILSNESIYIKGLTIIGVDYKSDPETVLRKTKIKGKSILMVHEPVGEKAAAKHTIDLVVSGHTHGGQFFPFTFFVKLFYRFTRGHHNYKGTDVIVSMGTLTWGPQLRIGSRNEIILIQ